ncbi:MAG: universal stress protein, partial [Chloroflexota bacterium]
EVLFLVILEPGEQKPSTHEAQFYIDAFDRDMKEAKDYLAGVQGSVKQMGIKCRGVVEYGSPVKTIIRVTESEDVDLVAMASHARSGLASAFSGGVAAGVLQGIRKPILVIRAPRKS